MPTRAGVARKVERIGGRRSWTTSRLSSEKQVELEVRVEGTSSLCYVT